MNEAKIPPLPFYFIRHGETAWNLEHKIMGQTDIELNETGIDQAYGAAYTLVDVEISKVFSSPLQRAYKTGKIISDVCEIEIEKIDQLKERGIGSFEGRSHDKNFSFLSDNNLAEDGETYLDFKNRIIEGVSKSLLSNYGYPIISSHSGVFKVLAHLLANRTDLPCPNCQIFFFTPPALNKTWDITTI